MHEASSERIHTIFEKSILTTASSETLDASLLVVEVQLQCPFGKDLDST